MYILIIVYIIFLEGKAHHYLKIVINCLTRELLMVDIKSISYPSIRWVFPSVAEE